MKNKIWLGILVTMVIVSIYGVIRLMSKTNLLNKEYASNFAPPVIVEEANMDNIVNEEDGSGNDGDKPMTGSSENFMYDEDDLSDYSTRLKGSEGIDFQANSSSKSITTASKSSETIAVSSDEINSIVKEITLSDKIKAVKLILSKLSASDIKILTDLSAGGLTKEEIEEIMQIAYSKYSKEDLELIKELYNMYLVK